MFSKIKQNDKLNFIEILTIQIKRINSANDQKVFWESLQKRIYILRRKSVKIR